MSCIIRLKQFASCAYNSFDICQYLSVSVCVASFNKNAYEHICKSGTAPSIGYRPAFYHSPIAADRDRQAECDHSSFFYESCPSERERDVSAVSALTSLSQLLTPSQTGGEAC